ncbi:MAG: hypothetical protein UX45_C0009G0028 [Candidatus Uhrbacteria bacterium GW2011_GWF2_46_218]|uniref:Uncharacterized protein n=1 Tax=Candidatus Uhrbacteria bacterium GW2011_GWF2_46_218 TaxID=1619001 RepID=A0A0G1SJF2_9BACT|nr:MAG: hypothetical protein UX45_C0009G0028 [Candidatus Uhrbacteria bacterium GW2011_GWF2_46_218]
MSNERSSLFEYASVRARLPEHVRVPLDVLREEVLAICAAHDVNHPTKLGRERVSKLLEDIKYIFEHRDLPLREKGDVDDQEYEVTLSGDLEDCITVLDQKGRFIFATYDTTPIRIYDQDGNEQILEDDVECVSFAYLGEDLVLIKGQPAMMVAFHRENSPWVENAYRKNAPNAPWQPTQGFRKTGTRISAVRAINKMGFYIYHPVGEDGEVHEEIAFKEEALENVAYVGNIPFFILRTIAGEYLISTAEETIIGNPRGYKEQPLFCEKNGRAHFIFINKMKHTISVMNDEGNLFEEDIPLPDQVASVTHALFINNTYVFTGFFENGNSVLFDERGTILWEKEVGHRFGPGRNESVKDLVACSSTFCLKTCERVSDSAGNEHHVGHYYDPDGKEIMHYKMFDLPENTPDPVFLNGSYAFVDSFLGHIYVKHGSNATPKTWVDIFALEQIDEYRFYVIGKEEIAEGTYQIAKRVYDTRTLEPAVKRRKKNVNPQTTP